MALARIVIICGCLWAAQGQLDAALPGALESDDACGAGGAGSEACQLGMLQKRKALETEVPEQIDPKEEAEWKDFFASVPEEGEEDITVSDEELDASSGEIDPEEAAEWKDFFASVPEADEENIVVPDDGSEASLAEVEEEEGEVQAELQGEREANSTADGHKLALPVIWAGRRSVGGIEACYGGNTGYCNSLMYRAHSTCPGGSCVQIVNPPGHRTRTPLHIHSYLYDGRGAGLKRKLTSRVCGKGGWVHGGFPCGGKAKYFGGYPPVFSVAKGAGGIGHACITVWPGSCGGGTIVLVSWHCSIEHSISQR